MKPLLRILSQHTLFQDDQILELKSLAQQGHCNQNYLLRTEKARCVLRIFGDEQRDRALEYHIQTLAYHEGIAPQPLLHDIPNNLMVSAFVEGEHQDRLSTAKLHMLAQTLHRLHSIALDIPPITLDTDTSSVTTYDFDPVLCHNDLNPQNILWHDHTPTRIDWEYAGINDRYFDLACVMVEFELEALDRKIFLETYFQDKTWDTKKLEAYIELYQKICQNWWENRPVNKQDIYIRKAKMKDLDTVFALVSLCTKHMLTQKIDQWDSLYPSHAILKRDIENESLFLAETLDHIVAIIVLNESQEPEYSDIDWQYTNGKPLIIHRLCVHPETQGKGIATKLMAFAENYAREKHHSTIRLDAFQANPIAVALYEKRGYRKVGVVRFRKGLFDCFEQSANR